MEYVRVVKGIGCKYVVNNNLFSQHSVCARLFRIVLGVILVVF